MSDTPYTFDLGGRRLKDRYQVEHKLGEGGMGQVYRAIDEHMSGRPVVVKVPHPLFLLRPGFRERFEREVLSLTRLEHPFIVSAMDVGAMDDDLPFVVLQYLAGGSLKDRLDRMRTPEAISEWLGAAAQALDFIHRNGVVHRDVKPANILFDREGHVKLADFGIAKALGSGDTTLTGAGESPGSPNYMAPESMSPSTLGPRYDQYSLAVVVFECLSGTLPHQGETPTDTLARKRYEPALRLSDLPTAVSPAAAEVVMRALDPQPAGRYDSCVEFAEAFLAACGRGTVTPPGPPLSQAETVMVGAGRGAGSPAPEPGSPSAAQPGSSSAAGVGSSGPAPSASPHASPPAARQGATPAVSSAPVPALRWLGLAAAVLLLAAGGLWFALRPDREPRGPVAGAGTPKAIAGLAELPRGGVFNLGVARPGEVLAALDASMDRLAPDLRAELFERELRDMQESLGFDPLSARAWSRETGIDPDQPLGLSVRELDRWGGPDYLLLQCGVLDEQRLLDSVAKVFVDEWTQLRPAAPGSDAWVVVDPESDTPPQAAWVIRDGRLYAGVWNREPSRSAWAVLERCLDPGKPRLGDSGLFAATARQLQQDAVAAFSVDAARLAGIDDGDVWPLGGELMLALDPSRLALSADPAGILKMALGLVGPGAEAGDMVARFPQRLGAVTWSMTGVGEALEVMRRDSFLSELFEDLDEALEDMDDTFGSAADPGRVSRLVLEGAGALILRGLASGNAEPPAFTLLVDGRDADEVHELLHGFLERQGTLSERASGPDHEIWGEGPGMVGRIDEWALFGLGDESVLAAARGGARAATSPFGEGASLAFELRGRELLKELEPASEEVLSWSGAVAGRARLEGGQLRLQMDLGATDLRQLVGWIAEVMNALQVPLIGEADDPWMVLYEVASAGEMYRADHEEYPTELRQLYETGEMPPYLPEWRTIDVWGQPVRLDLGSGELVVLSLGPDGILGTEDDLAYP